MIKATKMPNFIMGILFFIIGFRILQDGKIIGQFHEYDFQSIYVDKILGILIILFAIAFFYLAFRPKSHIKKYSNLEKLVKCKKCRKTFQYKDTNEGKCPTCNIDTIDIEEFYEVAKKRKDEKFFKKSKKMKGIE